MDWIRANPSAAVSAAVAIGATILALIRWAMLRHREYVAFTDHIEREETKIWPALQAQVAANHAEVLDHLSTHGERIARLEAKMPNCQLDEIKRMVEALLRRAR